MLKGAIFDFDGTLFDSMYVWETAGNLFLSSIGKEPKENLKKTLKTFSLFQAAEYLKSEYEINQTVEEIMQGINRTVENEYLLNVLPKPFVLDFLLELQKNDVKMCIATATEKYQVEAALKRAGLSPFFSEIFTCSDVGQGKDSPLIFEKALTFLGTEKDETLVFEDAFHAAETAHKSGFCVIGIFDKSEEKQNELRSISSVFLKDYFNTTEFWKYAQSL